MTVSSPTSSINTNIGIGYSAKSVIAYESYTNPFPSTAQSNVTPTQNIGMSTTSSLYPVANTIGANPYQPIEIVGTYSIPGTTSTSLKYTQINAPTYDTDYPPNNQTSPYFPPYNQLIAEGMIYREDTTNNVDNDLCFWRTSFQLNFIVNHTSSGNESTMSRPSSNEVYVGVSQFPHGTYSSFRWWNYIDNINFESGDYYIRIYYYPKTWDRKMMIHFTYL
jgi:hypothetical protein